MRTRFHRSFIIVMALLLTTAILLTPAISHAQGPKPGDKVVFGGAFSLTSGKTLAGDLAVLGGTVTIEQNATVNGDVAIIGGAASIDGVINGDIVALGGVITLGPHAVVTGDATAIGGVINRDPAAQVQGNIVGTNGAQDGFIGKIAPGGVQATPIAPNDFIDGFPGFPGQTHQSQPLSWLVRMMLAAFSAIAWTAILAGLGVLLVLLAPRPTERVATAISGNALLAFGVGFAAVLTSVPLIILLAITICLIPIAIIAPFILMGAWLLGWLSLGWLLGKELLKSANANAATPIWEAIVGIALLTLLWRIPTILPIVGKLAAFLVLFVAGNIAIGGALLTRFGLRSYPAETTTASTPPAPPADAQLSATSSLPPEAPAEPEHPPIIPPPPAAD